ncbi:MAG: acyltransferase [Lysinibacillus sp.]
MKPRIYYMDYLRTIAIIGVLSIHAAAPYATMYQKIDFSMWEAGIIYNSLSRWCVPIFFMISGALLLGKKEESLKEFFSKRANKILIPFVFWSVIYYLWRVWYIYKSAASFTEFKQLFLNANVYYHLWYFYALIGIYLLVPMFNVFCRYASQQIVGYTVAMYLLFFGVFRYYSFLVPNKLVNYFPLTEFIGIILLGFYLGKFDQSKRMRIIIYIAGIIGAIATILRTNALTIDQGQFSSYAFGYATPNVLAMSIALFVFFKYFIMKRQQNEQFAPSKLLQRISFTSFGIYLVHPMLLDVIRPYFHDANGIIIHPAIGIPVQIVVMLFASLIAVLIIGKIPYLKRVV